MVVGEVVCLLINCLGVVWVCLNLVCFRRSGGTLSVLAGVLVLVRSPSLFIYYASYIPSLDIR